MKLKDIKVVIYLFFCLFAVFLFSGCGANNNSTSNATKTSGNFLKSFDGGKNWERKIKIDEAKNIGLVNVLSLTVDSKDGNNIYLGTEKDGLFVTKNGGENWEKLVFPLTKIYGLAINGNDSKIIYASGILDKRAKIYKSLNEGKDWQEIYSEPANESVISSLEISRKDSNTLYCGTSEGMIFKTADGGQSWKNLTKAEGPVIDISFDAVDDKTVYFGVFEESVLKTADGGEKIDDLGKTNLREFIKGKSFSWKTYSVEADPQFSGVFYVGTDSGMLKGIEFGKKWEEINLLESSKDFPIRAIAVNPKNSSEIIYGSTGVIYRSVDGGATWLTFQLNTSNEVEVIEYDLNNPGNVFTGLRKI